MMKYKILNITAMLLIQIIVMQSGCNNSHLFSICSAAVDSDILAEKFYPEKELALEKYGLKEAAELFEKGNVEECREIIAEYFSIRQFQGNMDQWPAHGNAIQRAEELLNNRYRLAGYDVYELPPNPAWQENPPKLNNWEFLFHALDFMKDLNEAYRQTKDKRFINRAKEFIIDYMDHNFVPDESRSQYSWYDMAVAYRAIHSIDFINQYRDSGVDDRTFPLLFLEFIWRHAKYLASDEYYGKTSNHGLFCNVALLRIALAYPEFRQSDEWKKIVVLRMEQQVKDNYSKEGVHKENSSGYHVLTANWLMRFIQDSRIDKKIALSEEFQCQLDNIFNYVPYLFLPDGTIALIGDTSEYEAENILRPLGAINPYIQYIQTNGKLGVAPKKTSAAFPDAQMFVMRSGWGTDRPYKEESCLIADLTELGISTHAHFDFMNFEFYSKGFRWITDLGSLTYNHEDPRRKYLISSLAHNVVVPYINAQPDKLLAREQLLGSE